MDWSNEVTLIFLKLYEQEPAIWNPRDPQNKNRKVVNDAWLRIQRSLGTECSVTDLKKKKESLMATFRPLLNKMNASRKANNGTDDVYTPTWFAFDTMAKFLHKIYQPRTIINKEDLVPIPDETEQNGKETNLEDEEIQTTIDEETQTTIDEETSVDEETQTTIAEDGEKNVTKIFSKNLSADNAFSSTPERGSRKNKRSYMERIENRIEDAYKIMKTVCDIPNKDVCSQFADLLTTKLKTFDEQDRDILMNEIENLIFKAKMQKRIQHSETVPTTSTFSENYYH